MADGLIRARWYELFFDDLYGTDWLKTADLVPSFKGVSRWQDNYRPEGYSETIRADDTKHRIRDWSGACRSTAPLFNPGLLSSQ